MARETVLTPQGLEELKAKIMAANACRLYGFGS
mgnify:CR=1 FL=1